MKICNDCEFLIGECTFINRGFCSIYKMFIEKRESACEYLKPKNKEEDKI